MIIHEILYKVVTCFNGSRVNNLLPGTSEVPGIGHGQSTSANGDGLYVDQRKTNRTLLMRVGLFWMCRFLNGRSSTKKLVFSVSVISSFVLFPKV